MPKPKLVSNPPSPGKTMFGLSQGGYSLATAIADIVDNSITARADNIWITIESTVDENAVICIWDDGCGMEKDELKDAMNYGFEGSDEEDNTLGRFGFGLKTASLAISRTLDVVTRIDDEPLHWAQWNMDHVERSGKWEHILDKATEDLSNEFHEKIDPEEKGYAGTMVKWNNVYTLQPGSFDGVHRGQATRRVREHLELTFHRFLEDESLNEYPEREVKIFINGDQIKAWNPYAPDEPEILTPLRDSYELKVSIDGREEIFEVEAVAHILPARHKWTSKERERYYQMAKATARQGIYVYREDRVIIPHTWLGLWNPEPHSNLCRFELHFHRDADKAFELTFMKDAIELKEDVVEKVKEIFENCRKMGEQRYRERQVVPTARPDHSGSSSIIDDTYDETSNIEIEDDDGEITVTKDEEYVVDIERTPEGEHRIKAVPVLSYNSLWEPTLMEPNAGMGCNLSESHEFYRRVYFPLKGNALATKGLDLLLFALAEAEYDRNANLDDVQMEQWRLSISQKLQRRAMELPEHEPE